MSFKFSGISNVNKDEQFSYVKENCPDDDSFDLANLTSALYLMGKNPVEAVKAQVPNEGAAIIEAYKGTLKIESAHNLVNAVNFLILKSASTNGTILVTSEEVNLLFPNKSARTTFIMNGNNSGSDFIRQIYPVLEDTNMNNYGVLLQMWKFINQVANKIYPDVRPVMTISLTR